MAVRFWLAWSLRDLRKRWLTVAAIALTVALGTGVYAGLASLSEWRRVSNDVSFSRTGMHDLHVSLTVGSYVRSGALRAAVATIPSSTDLRASEERLVVPTLVDTTPTGVLAIVPGRIVGMGLGAGATVDRAVAMRGRGLRPGDDGRMVALLSRHFPQITGLPDTGRLRLSGRQVVRYVGQGLEPEYFLASAGSGAPFDDGSGSAVLFMGLRTAQRLAGLPGKVNDLVIALRPGTDVHRLQREVQAALARSFPAIGATVERKDQDTSYHLLYADIPSDQRIFDVFAFVLLAGAAFAAFNLASRVVEAQRREIGIGMAIGLPPSRIAIRPLLLGLEIALAGALLGVGVGVLIGDAFVATYKNLLPLPSWQTPFQTAIYLRGAAIGFVITLLASVYPTWRAVRVSPVDAIRTGYRSARGGGLAPLVARLPLPGSTFGRMPVHNVLRAPRRTLLTALGIAAAITTLVGVAGMIDSFFAAADRNRTELLRGEPNRVAATLRGFTANAAHDLTAVEHAAGVARAEPGLQFPATLRRGPHQVDVSLELIDAASRIWRPTIRAGRFAPWSVGVAISEKAARDLGVRVGDTLVLRHPRRTSATAFATVETAVPVAAVHPDPIRIYAYMDRSQAFRFGLAGYSNVVQIAPARGVTSAEIARTLLSQPAVAAAQPVAITADALHSSIESFTDILAITELASLALALLVAYNTAAITIDERSREHATMFAFGVPLRTVLRISLVESLLMGMLGTIIGIGLGYAVVTYVVRVLTPAVLPEVGATATLSSGTLLLAVLMSTAAAITAPLLSGRRLQRMDIPSTLRVVE